MSTDIIEQAYPKVHLDRDSYVSLEGDRLVVYLSGLGTDGSDLHVSVSALCTNMIRSMLNAP